MAVTPLHRRERSAVCHDDPPQLYGHWRLSGGLSRVGFAGVAAGRVSETFVESGASVTILLVLAK